MLLTKMLEDMLHSHAPAPNLQCNPKKCFKISNLGRCLLGTCGIGLPSSKCKRYGCHVEKLFLEYAQAQAGVHRIQAFLLNDIYLASCGIQIIPPNADIL